jgi:hypothetical protein
MEELYYKNIYEYTEAGGPYLATSRTSFWKRTLLGTALRVFKV